MKAKKKEFKPTKSECAFIGAVLLVSFFVIWFLLATVLNDLNILSWIERNSGLAAWVQAIGALIAIIATAFIAQRDTKLRNIEREKSHAREMRKIRYLLHKTPLIDALGSYLIKVDFSKDHRSNKDINKYNNIFFLMFTSKEINSAVAAIDAVDSERMMELRTSELGDYFADIFLDIEYLSSIYKQNSEYLIFDEEMNRFRGFFKYIRSNTSNFLEDVNDDLEGDIFYARKVLIRLKKSFEYINRQLYLGEKRIR